MKKIHLDETSICYEYLNDKTLLELSNKYHVSHETIRRILKKNNIKLRKNGGFKSKEYVNIEQFDRTQYIGIYKKDMIYYAIWKRYKNKYYILISSENIKECLIKYNEKAIKSKRRGIDGAINIF